MVRPRVLVLGGVDPCGGAGITADARVLELHGCHALTVASCSTVQNRHGFYALAPLPTPHVVAAMRAALDDGPLHAIKLGLLTDAPALRAMTELLVGRRLPIVVDPVLSATAGGYTATGAMVQAYRATGRELRAILTPNRAELARLAPERGAAELLALGCATVVEKGGHDDGADVLDRVHTRDGETVLQHPRVACGLVHGTGCALASALAAGLARGQDVVAAATAAVQWMGRCLAAMGAPEGDGLPRPFVPLPPA